MLTDVLSMLSTPPLELARWACRSARNARYLDEPAPSSIFFPTMINVVIDKGERKRKLT